MTDSGYQSALPRTDEQARSNFSTADPRLTLHHSILIHTQHWQAPSIAEVRSEYPYLDDTMGNATNFVTTNEISYLQHSISAVTNVPDSGYQSALPRIDDEMAT